MNMAKVFVVAAAVQPCDIAKHVLRYCSQHSKTAREIRKGRSHPIENLHRVLPTHGFL